MEPYSRTGERVVLSFVGVAILLASLTMGIAAAHGATTRQRRWVSAALFSLLAGLVLVLGVVVGAVFIYISPFDHWLKDNASFVAPIIATIALTTWVFVVVAALFAMNPHRWWTWVAVWVVIALISAYTAFAVMPAIISCIALILWARRGQAGARRKPATAMRADRGPDGSQLS